MVSYAWTQLAGPTISLTGNASAQASFTAPTVTEVTKLVFSLLVTDNEGETNADAVEITVTPVNQLPIADAGPDQIVLASSTVSLNGGSSSDLDGAIVSYTWAQTLGPAVALSDTKAAETEFTTLVATETTELTFLLTVVDNEGESSTDSVNITVASFDPETTPISALGLSTSLYNCLSNFGALEVINDVGPQVNCDDFGLTSLDGIEFFAEQIEELSLEDNDLADDDFDEASDPIYQLINLEYLGISGNWEIRLSDTVNLIFDLLPDAIIENSRLNAAGVNVELIVEIVFDSSDEPFFEYFGEAIVEGVRLRGLENDSFDNSSDPLYLFGDLAEFYPVRNGSTAQLTFTSVRPGLVCEDEEFSMIDDVYFDEPSCSLNTLGEYTITLGGGGFDSEGRESDAVDGLELVFQEQFPYTDDLASVLDGTISAAVDFTGDFPLNEELAIYPGFIWDSFSAPDGVMCEPTPTVTMEDGITFVLPCSQSITHGESALYGGSTHITAGNQLHYELRVKEELDLSASALADTDHFIQFIDPVANPSLSAGGNNSQLVTLGSMAPLADVEELLDITLSEDTYLVGIQNLNTTQDGNSTLEVLTDGFMAPGLRPLLPVDSVSNSWTNSNGGGDKSDPTTRLDNPTYILEIESSDGGSDDFSGALVKIDLDSTKDTYLIVADFELDLGGNQVIVGVNDDREPNTLGSTVFLRLAPGSYRITAATYNGAQNADYEITVVSSMPAFTTLTKE